jgi:hypothetical protein
VTLRGAGNAQRSVKRTTLLPANLPPNVVAVETLDVQPGAYEVTVEGEEGSVALSEFVWILSRDDYRLLVQSEASEKFSFEPIISTSKELARMLDNEVSVVWPGHKSPFEISWSADNGPISYPPLQWTSEAIVRAVRYVGAFGISKISGFISIAGAKLGR